MKIAEQITVLRTRAGLSQEALAEQLEVSRQSVSKWETGASVPEIEKLVKMSELFGVTLDELVTGAVPKPSEPEGNTVPVRKNVNLRRILGVAFLVLAGLCVAMTVLFEGPLGIHRSEGLLLAAWFALVGLIALNTENEKRRRGCMICLGVTTVLLLVRTIVPLYVIGIILLAGAALVIWAM